MKAVLFTKSGFTNLEVLHKQFQNLNYILTSFNDCLRIEVSEKTEFGKYLTKQLNQNRGLLSENDQQEVWKKMFDRYKEFDKVIIQVSSNIDNYKLLQNEMDNRFISSNGQGKILNLYLESKIIRQRAEIVSDKYKSIESKPKIEFLKEMMNREKRRIEFLNEVKRIENISIVNVDMNQNQKVIVSKILREINEYSKG